MSNFMLTNRKNWLVGLERCGDCPRCNTRKEVFPGIGQKHDPAIFFIAGKVTEHENKVNPGNKFRMGGDTALSTELTKFGLSRLKDCYVSPIIKCWAPEEPTTAHRLDCENYLEVELQQVNPSLIVLLGQEAVDFWWANTTANMTLDLARGKTWGTYQQKIIATFDPDLYAAKRTELRDEWAKDWTLIGSILETQHKVKVPTPDPQD